MAPDTSDNKEWLETIKRHEGYRRHPYRCTAGKLTIGYGTNLDDRGVTETEAEFLLKSELYHNVIPSLKQRLKGYKEMPLAAREVLVNMAYQLGVDGLLKFKKFLNALRDENYKEAAKEMLDSVWAKQTPHRARELSDIIAKL